MEYPKLRNSGYFPISVGARALKPRDVPSSDVRSRRTSHFFLRLLAVAVTCVLILYLIILHAGPHPTIIRNFVEEQHTVLEYQYPSLHAKGLALTTEDEEILPRVTVMMIINNAASFGHVFNPKSSRKAPLRTIKDVFNVIGNFSYPPHLLSLGMLISDAGLYEKVRKVIAGTPESRSLFSRVTLVHTTRDPHLEGDRHSEKLQKRRRRFLATLRNTLLNYAMEDSDSVLWIDADMCSIPSNTLESIVSTGKEIVTIRIQEGTNDDDFDMNSWKGERTRPTEAERASGDFVPHHKPGTKFVSSFAGTGEDVVELDSVGGAVLYVKSDLHRFGVVFPPIYIVGTDWDTQEGYDGIETEGICYIAKALGYKCWAMPNITAIHALR